MRRAGDRRRKAGDESCDGQIGRPLAPAIPGSGGGGGPDEPQPVWNPAAAQVVPTGVGAPW